tara:strand:- start:2834 stop:2998 length:165 start_codon:yes stop_codon:yes gene_type:complete
MPIRSARPANGRVDASDLDLQRRLRRAAEAVVDAVGEAVDLDFALGQRCAWSAT